MNTSRLQETIEQLLQAEASTNFQGILSEVSNHLSTLASQPSSSEYQTTFANSLERLRDAYKRMQAKFEPAQMIRFAEINAGPYFSEDIPAEIGKKIAENPATPAVAQQFVADLRNRRQQFLSTLEETHDRLSILGITASGLKSGDAEIGFTIPRYLFDDNLDGLLGELREIRLIIRAFSEVTTGSAEPIIVKQISTTDPLFFSVCLHAPSLQLAKRSIGFSIHGKK